MDFGCTIPTNAVAEAPSQSPNWHPVLSEGSSARVTQSVGPSPSPNLLSEGFVTVAQCATSAPQGFRWTQSLCWRQWQENDPSCHTCSCARLQILARWDPSVNRIWQRRIHLGRGQFARRGSSTSVREDVALAGTVSRTCNDECGVVFSSGRGQASCCAGNFVCFGRYS